MNTIKFQKIRDGARKPERASNGAVGYDVYASIVLDKHTKKPIGELPVTILPGGSILIGIGVRFALLWPWQCEVRPRSGLANKYDVELSNSPGTIDPDFRGEAGVLLRNRGDKPFVVEKDMRVAQLVFSEAKIPVLEESEKLPPSLRGSGGFGSTGLFEIKEGTANHEQKTAQLDKFFMRIACEVAGLSQCTRGVPRDENGKLKTDPATGKWINQTRKFGCIIVKNGNIVAMGVNAQCEGSESCAEVGCIRDRENIPSGTQIERCRAVHAEWWAFINLLRTGGGSVVGADLYLNAEPCEMCARMIAQAGIENVILLKGTYPKNGTAILKDAGVNIRYVE